MKDTKKRKLDKKRHGKQGSSEQRRLRKKDKSESKAVPQTPPAGQKTAPSTSKPFSARIADIVIRSNRRKTDQEGVLPIGASMDEVGQLEPIMVREERKKVKGSLKTSTALILVDGQHLMNPLIFR